MRAIERWITSATVASLRSPPDVRRVVLLTPSSPDQPSPSTSLQPAAVRRDISMLSSSSTSTKRTLPTSPTQAKKRRKNRMPPSSSSGSVSVSPEQRNPKQQFRAPLDTSDVHRDTRHPSSSQPAGPSHHLSGRDSSYRDYSERSRASSAQRHDAERRADVVYHRSSSQSSGYASGSHTSHADWTYTAHCNVRGSSSRPSASLARQPQSPSPDVHHDGRQHRLSRAGDVLHHSPRRPKSRSPSPPPPTRPSRRSGQRRDRH